MLAATGCGEPMVDVVAVWVDGVADDQGNRHVRIYDAGDRDELPVVPDIPGTSLDLLHVGVDDRGQGVAVSGDDATVWVERSSGRQVTLAQADAGPGALPGEFFFARGGDALLQRFTFEEDPLPLWLVAPLSGPGALDLLSLRPPRAADESKRWSLHHATDAPVMVLAEMGGSPAAVSGMVQAIAYPSAWGEGPVVDDLRPLAQGTMVGMNMTLDGTRYLVPPACPERLCPSPSGRWLYAMAGSRCDLLRWSWVDAPSSEQEVAVETVPLVCPGEETAALLAVIDDDLVVLDDPHRLYLVDLGANRTQTIAKPSGRVEARLAGRGRVLLVSAPSGDLVRVDAMGPRMINGIQSPCNDYDALAVSPSGNWVVRSCNGQVTAPEGVDGQVQRVSVLGAELYGGIPMRPIAIDDDGNALLYSISSDEDDDTPRGLFVLSGDGTLSRVDELEPFPGQVTFNHGAGEQLRGRFAAAGPR
ncbi:MAG: hypothetical protein H6712_08820 [Myxococcales bacterium]|nr:hypothetical protein [Myxococcales bacterium]MCB9713942.1 hypothetical protein [Myxococcales bacterium]